MSTRPIPIFPANAVILNAPEAVAKPPPKPPGPSPKPTLGFIMARPINAAHNNIFPTPLPAPVITGTKCISSCPIG